MDVKFKTVILECSDIPQLQSFYTGLLHWPVVFAEETFVRIQSNQGEVGIAFQYDEDYIVDFTRWLVPSESGRLSSPI